MIQGRVWFYVADGQQLGPVPEDELRRAIWAGAIAWDSPVWTQGMSGWSQARSIPEFSPAPSTVPTAPPPPVRTAARQRQGCLTAWLGLMVAANSLLTVLYIGFSIARPPTTLPGAVWVYPILALIEAANVVFTVALFRWKRWGFYGFAANGAIIFAINLAVGVNPLRAAFGLAGVGVLFGVLLIGGANAAWPQLD